MQGMLEVQPGEGAIGRLSLGHTFDLLLMLQTSSQSNSRNHPSLAGEGLH